MPELDFKIINIHLLSAKLTCFLLALVPQVKQGTGLIHVPIFIQVQKLWENADT